MTTSMWQQMDEAAKKADQGNGVWLKLPNDGDKAALVFLGEPLPREVCFIDGKFVEATDKLKQEGQKISTRFAINVALFDTQEVKVIEQGLVFYKDLVRVRDKYGLAGWAFEVQRHGAAKDPKTSYSILPEHQLTAEQQKAFKSLALHDLNKLYSGETGEAGRSIGTFDKKAGSTLEPKVAQEVVLRLKTLPREAVDRFLQQFGIQRVKDLTQSQLQKANELVEELEMEFALPSVTDEFIDPFA